MRDRVSRLFLTFCATLIVCALAGPSMAHHANSAYDRSQEISVTGTVTRWQFINPHAGLWIEVTDNEGRVSEWNGEFPSIQDLYRSYGWNKDTFKPGDRVTILGAPDRRPGRQSLCTNRIVFADGKEVDVRNTPD